MHQQFGRSSVAKSVVSRSGSVRFGYHTVLDFILYVSDFQMLQHLRKKNYFTCIHIFVYRLHISRNDKDKNWSPTFALSI